jgi:hypothetical protein
LYSLASVAVGIFTRVGLVDAIEVGTEANLIGAYLRDDGANHSVNTGMDNKHIFPRPYSELIEVPTVFPVFPRYFPLMPHRLANSGFDGYYKGS